MKANAYCRKILKEYPEVISKEQMRIICSISKKTCLYLLTSGLVPCLDTGKKTHRFQIKTTDVILYLKDREINPQKYRPPDGYYIQDAGPGSLKRNCEIRTPPMLPITDQTVALMRSFFVDALKEYPDVLITDQIAEFTGYNQSSVIGWCNKQKLKHFHISRKYYVPKEYLLDYLVSDHFIRINRKSKEHIQFIYALLNCIKDSKIK